MHQIVNKPTEAVSAAEDRRPWMPVKIQMYDNFGEPIPGAFRVSMVAHADLQTMLRGGCDARWPLGSAMNAIPPGEPTTVSRIDGMVRHRPGFSIARDTED